MTERTGPGGRKEDEQCAAHHEAITRIVTTMQVLGTVAALMGALVCYIYNGQTEQVKQLSDKLDRYNDAVGTLSVVVAKHEERLRVVNQ